MKNLKKGMIARGEGRGVRREGSEERFSPSELGELQANDNIHDRHGRCDDAVRPEDRAADEPLEGVA